MAKQTPPEVNRIVITWEDKTQKPLVVLTGMWTFPEINSMQQFVHQELRKQHQEEYKRLQQKENGDGSGE